MMDVSFLEEEAFWEEGEQRPTESGRAPPGRDLPSERPWPSSARSLDVDVGRLRSRQVSWLPGQRRSSEPSPRPLGLWVTRDGLRTDSPATVAGPRRYSTCFPFTLLLWRHPERRRENSSAPGEPARRTKKRAPDFRRGR